MKHRSSISRLLAAAFALTVASCGYHGGYGGTTGDYTSISVPYVEGDRDGRLTAELAREISRTGALQYKSCHSDLVLHVKLLDSREENIGFRYDRDQDGTRTNSVIPIETRVTALAEVTIVEQCSCTVILGPDLISAAVDYDHDYYSNHGGVNLFSLGQLNDLDLAQQVAFGPLSKALALAIAEHIVNAW